MKKNITQNQLRNIFIPLLLLLFSLISSADARKDKNEKKLQQFKITILTQAIGDEISSIVPKQLRDFWGIIKTEDRELLIPEVRCMRIDIIPEAEFTPERPEDTWDVMARKKLGTWKDENEREHLLTGIDKQQIGEKFSSKTQSAKNSKDIEKTVIERGKDMKQERLFVYAPYLKNTEQLPSEVNIASSVKGRTFTDAMKLIEKFQEQVIKDIKSNRQQELNYLILYNVKLPQIEREKKLEVKPPPPKDDKEGKAVEPLNGNKKRTTKSPKVNKRNENKKSYNKKKLPETYPSKIVEDNKNNDSEILKKNAKALEEEIKNRYERINSLIKSDKKELRKSDYETLIQRHKIQKDNYIRLKETDKAEKTQKMIDNLERLKRDL